MQIVNSLISNNRNRINVTKIQNNKNVTRADLQPIKLISSELDKKN